MSMFSIGRTLATPGALAALEEAGQSPAFFLDHHGRGDWGDVNAEDQRANDEALISGERQLLFQRFHPFIDSPYPPLSCDRVRQLGQRDRRDTKAWNPGTPEESVVAFSRLDPG